MLVLMLELARAKSNHHIILCKWIGFLMGQPLMLKIVINKNEVDKVGILENLSPLSS